MQSTRAGADAGFALAGVILLALILKYPFFEYGPRYAAATGDSLVEGYLRIGRWALWLYFGITVVTSVIVQAAVVAFTAFLVKYVFGLDWSLALTATVLIAGCALLLWRGRFRMLDLAVKLILVLLAVSTVTAAVVSAPRIDLASLSLWPGTAVGRLVPFGFVLALAGWMPSAIDIAVWSSLWTLAKDEDTGTRASVRTAQLDFVAGYLGTGVLAFAFVILGTAVMFGSGESFSNQGTVFATQLVEMYSVTLGSWMRPVVTVAVLTTMLSTTLTVVDGFPRALERSVFRLFERDATRPAPSGHRAYWAAIAAMWAATVVVLAVAVHSLTALVDFATIVSFMTAPVLGYLNLRAVTGHEVAAQYRPGRAMRWLSWTGLILLGGTALVFAYTLVSQ